MPRTSGAARSAPPTGDTVPPEDTEAAGPPGDPAEVARIVCLRLLDRKACTRAELAQALHRRQIPEEVAARVLDRFVEVGLIDDAALASGYALAQHHERGLAGRAVAQKLRRRGVADDAVRAALDPIDAESELQTARMLVARRSRSMTALAPEVRARRLVGLLARKGYGPGIAHRVVREAVGEWAELAAGPGDD